MVFFYNKRKINSICKASVESFHWRFYFFYLFSFLLKLSQEALTELPTNSYITGMLYPADSDITEDENYNDVEFTEGRLDADGNGSESVVLEDEEPDESTKGEFKKPSSIGVSFYLSEETNKINVDVYWGSYYSD